MPLPPLPAGRGIVGGDRGATVLERREQAQSGGIANVVGVGLEGDAEHGDVPAGDVAAQSGDDTIGKGPALRLSFAATTASIRLERVCAAARRGGKRRVSLGKHEPPKPGPGLQIVMADAVVVTHAAGDHGNVGADLLAQIGKFVHDRQDASRDSRWRHI